VDSLWQDLRLATRNLRRTPGFTFFAVLMLAIGIGATTTVFSMVNAVLLQPFPFEDPDQLVVAWKQDLSRDTPYIEISFSEYLDWRMQSRSFQELSAFTAENHRYIWENPTQKLSVECAVVSTSFLEALGIRPFLGRDFLPEDDEAGAPRVVLLGYEFWQRHFESDLDVIGESITLSGEPFAIIGVLPAGYGFPSGAQLWMPAGPAIADALRKLSIPAAHERSLGRHGVS
jgi:hypothetical protein